MRKLALIAMLFATATAGTANATFVAPANMSDPGGGGTDCNWDNRGVITYGAYICACPVVVYNQEGRVVDWTCYWERL